jgi:hypothetical protein
MQAFIEMIQEEEREKYGSSYVPPSNANPAGPRSTLSPPEIPESTKPDLGPQTKRSRSDSVLIDLSNDDETYSDSWACSTCTLVNPATFLCCDACGSERPQPIQREAASKPSANKGLGSSRRHPQMHNTLKPRSKALQSLLELEKNTPQKPLGWVCHFCGTFMEMEWWTCSTCGTMKQTS